MEAVWLQDCRGSFASMIADKQRREAAEAKSQAAQSVAQPDELIDFVHLKVRNETLTCATRLPVRNNRIQDISLPLRCTAAPFKADYQ